MTHIFININFCKTISIRKKIKKSKFSIITILKYKKNVSFIDRHFSFIDRYFFSLITCNKGKKICMCVPYYSDGEYITFSRLNVLFKERGIILLITHSKIFFTIYFFLPFSQSHKFVDIMRFIVTTSIQN